MILCVDAFLLGLSLYKRTCGCILENIRRFKVTVHVGVKTHHFHNKQETKGFEKDEDIREDLKLGMTFICKRNICYGSQGPRHQVPNVL